MNRLDLKERIATSNAFNTEEALFLMAAIDAAPDRDTFVSSPKNHLPRIERIWAFLSVRDGSEGVCAAPFGDLTLPLIAADEQRLTNLRPVATMIAKRLAVTVRLACFRDRVDQEIFE